MTSVTYVGCNVAIPSLSHSIKRILSAIECCLRSMGRAFIFEIVCTLNKLNIFTLLFQTIDDRGIHQKSQIYHIACFNNFVSASELING